VCARSVGEDGTLVAPLLATSNDVRVLPPVAFMDDASTSSYDAMIVIS
jgi:hypothetical protein